MVADADSLRQRIAAIPVWYHRISLPDGIVTPGINPLDPAAYRIPDDLTGKRVLDVGAWDGYWTFEALKRGARAAVGIDDFSDYLGYLKPEQRRGWQSFDLCREALGYSNERCQRTEISLYDITEEKLGGRFDVAFCFGTLYHLRHPLLGLDRISAVCDGQIFVEFLHLRGLQRRSRRPGSRISGQAARRRVLSDRRARRKSNQLVGTEPQLPGGVDFRGRLYRQPVGLEADAEPGRHRRVPRLRHRQQAPEDNNMRSLLDCSTRKIRSGCSCCSPSSSAAARPALTGRAIAATWRPWWHVIPLTLLLGAAVRFLHFALFGGTLLSPTYYVADTAVCLVCGLIGFRLMRVAQMVTCYGWINERADVLQLGAARRFPAAPGRPNPDDNRRFCRLNRHTRLARARIERRGGPHGISEGDGS